MSQEGQLGHMASQNQARPQQGQIIQREQNLPQQARQGPTIQQGHQGLSEIDGEQRPQGLGARLPRATLEEKIHILNFYHRSGKAQSDTVEEFKNQYAISTSSFSEWLKHETELRERYNQSVSLTELSGNHIRQSKRKVRFKYERINHAMDTLVERRLADGLPINEPILRDHWAIYARQFGVDDPKRLYSFSHGWLSQFKKRHGLDKKTMLEINRRANTSSPSTIPLKATDDGTTNDGRFYEVSQLLNSPQHHTNGDRNGGGVLGNNRMDEVEVAARFNEQENNQNPEVARHLQNVYPLQAQLSGGFGSQTYPLMAPYIRLDNQVNRNGSHPNQLLSALNNQQQQLQMLNSNQSLQQELAHKHQPQIRNGTTGNGNINNGNSVVNNSRGTSKNSNTNGNNNNTINSNNNNNNGNNSSNSGNDAAALQKNLLSGNVQTTGEVNSRLADLSGNDNVDIDSDMVNSVGSAQMATEDSAGEVASDDELFNISMEDIEKFMYQWCDKFFHDHQRQFPKTSKIFRNFKDSFMREKFKAMMNGGNSAKFINDGEDTDLDPNNTAATDNSGNPNVSVDNFFLRNVQPRSSNQGR